MNFGRTEKIESVILRPSANLEIKNVVTFGKRAYKKGNRMDAIYEYDYKSSKYSNFDILSTISLETSDFLVFSGKSLEEKNSKGFRKKEEIYCTYQHIEKIRKFFNTLKKYMQNKHKNKDGKYDQVYIKKDDILYLNPNFEDFELTIKKLVNNKSMLAYFDIETLEDVSGNVTQKRVIRLILNNEDIIATITMDELNGIVYFIDNFNLLLSSQNLTMISYMKVMTNNLDIEDENYNVIRTKNYNGTISRPDRVQIYKEDIEEENEDDEEDFMKIPEDADPNGIPFN
jgi:hypothetical protein